MWLEQMTLQLKRTRWERAKLKRHRLRLLVIHFHWETTCEPTITSHRLVIQAHSFLMGIKTAYGLALIHFFCLSHESTVDKEERRRGILWVDRTAGLKPSLAQGSPRINEANTGGLWFIYLFIMNKILISAYLAGPFN